MIYVTAMKHKKKTSRKPKQRIAANLWGIHAVREAWMNKDRTIRGLYATEQGLKNIEDILDQRKTPPSMIDRKDLDRLLPAGAVHQGLALHSEPLDECFIQDLIIDAQSQQNPLILMLDQVTDPHNVGAIMRSACAFGACGMVMQRKHSPELTGVLAKTACGAVEHLPVAYEINLSETIDKLKESGFFVIGLDERGNHEIGNTKKGGKTAIVLGAEGKGLRPKVAEHCDELVKLPTQGAIASLNVSNAAAVALYALKA
jgi:23S rRNA (guanosine2251-2'-O)-methyltransferase